MGREKGEEIKEEEKWIGYHKIIQNLLKNILCVYHNPNLLFMFQLISSMIIGVTCQVHSTGIGFEPF